MSNSLKWVDSNYLINKVVKKLTKIKLHHLTESPLNIEELSKITGGEDIMLFDGCYSGVCKHERSTAYSLCAGAAWCTSGVGG